MSDLTLSRRLPAEITEKFLLNLPISDIKQLCSVNSKVYQICSNDSFWRLLVQRDFDIKAPSPTTPSFSNTDSYKCLYQMLSSNLFIVTIVNSYYTPDEGENENDLRPHAFSVIFLTLKEAVNYAIESIDNTGLLKLRDFDLATFAGLDIDPQFISDLRNENYESFMNDPDKLSQLSHLRKVLIDNLKSTATEKVIMDKDHEYVIEITDGYTNNITISMQKIYVQTDLEPKYDMLHKYYNANIGGTSVDEVSFAEMLNKISKSKVPVQVKNGIIYYEDWYAREIRFLDPAVNDAFITRLNNLIHQHLTQHNLPESIHR